MKIDKFTLLKEKLYNLFHPDWEKKLFTQYNQEKQQGDVVYLEAYEDFLRREKIQSSLNACLAYSIQYSIENHHNDFTEYVTQKGGKLASQHNEMLLVCLNNNKINLVKYLIDNGANHRYKEDNFFLVACAYGDLNLVQYLFDKGVDINAGNGYCLINSIRCNHFNIFQYLIEKGANIHKNDFILESAIILGNKNFIQYLIDNGIYLNDAIGYASGETKEWLKEKRDLENLNIKLNNELKEYTENKIMRKKIKIVL